MGTCPSCQGRQRVDDPSAPSAALPPGTSPRGPRIGDMPKHFASLESRTPWGKPAQLVLANASKYNVSYWVIQEDKLKAKAHREHVAKSMGAHFGVSNTGAAVSADVDREKETSTEMEEVEHVLTRDHRMGKHRSTQPTKVRFPENCKELRVYGYFQREDGAWILYKDKVYSIGRFFNDFALTALDSSIAPHNGTATAAREGE